MDQPRPQIHVARQYGHRRADARGLRGKNQGGKDDQILDGVGVRCAQSLGPRGKGFGCLWVPHSAADTAHNNAIEHIGYPQCTGQRSYLNQVKRIRMPPAGIARMSTSSARTNASAAPPLHTALRRPYASHE